MSYNSNVLSAGRNYGINQKSFSPGISYYHKSGLYTDYSGYWNSSTTPNYNLSIFTLGYLIAIGKHWILSGNYERWWYHQDPSSTLNNSLGSTFTFSTKYWYTTLDYSYFFGKDNAHRVIGSVTGKINLGKWWKFTSIRLLPSATTFFGNSYITMRFSPSTKELAREGLGIYNDLKTSPVFRNYIKNTVNTEDWIQIRDLLLRRRSQPYQDGKRILDILNSYPSLNNLLQPANQVKKVYGIMDYNFSLPLSLQTKHLSILLTYTYSIPIALPGEETTLDPVSYFGASISYRIPLNLK